MKISLFKIYMNKNCTPCFVLNKATFIKRIIKKIVVYNNVE